MDREREGSREGLKEGERTREVKKWARGVRDRIIR